jgi:transposase
MGRQTGDQRQLFYLFNLEGRIPASHLLRRINPVVTRVLTELREKLAPFYSEIGRPSIDPELMIRMLIVGYCYGIRFERRLCEEVEMHLAYRWFCRLDLDDKVPDHSTFSVNRHGRFRDSDIFRQLFEAVVRACMEAGLVKGEGFAVPSALTLEEPCYGGPVQAEQFGQLRAVHVLPASRVSRTAALSSVAVQDLHGVVQACQSPRRSNRSLG